MKLLVLSWVVSVLFLEVAYAQSPLLLCNATGVPPVVHAEGITERAGDIVISCGGGAPGARVTGNLAVFLNENITNRIDAKGFAPDALVTVDTGAGFQPGNVTGQLVSNSEIVYNGLAFTLSQSGTATLRIANLRGNAHALGFTGPGRVSLQAYVAFNAGSLVSLTPTQFPVGTPLPGLLAGFSSKLICSPRGVPAPDSTSFSDFISSGALFSTTRVTEGFADSFSPRNSVANFNADSGTRILVRYSNFVTGSRLFVPNVVSGSDAVQPTAGGDFGLPASGGRFAPSVNGSLLLARVAGADANGGGGAPVYVPDVPGSGTVAFDSLAELPLTNGTAYAVYEVVDANNAVQESAQFPTFLGLPAFTSGPAVQTNEEVFLAPVSTVQIADPTAPIPRFTAVPPPSDCRAVGDCNASYFPVLLVNTNPIRIPVMSGGGGQPAYVQVRNQGGGVLRWNASVQYLNGSGFLRIVPSQGINNGTIRIDAVPGAFAPGTYQAVLTVDAGPMAGTQTVPITVIIAATPQPAAQGPAIRSVVNAASLKDSAVVAGSLATIMGARLGGSHVTVTFDGMSAPVLFSNDSQINLQIPDALSARSAANVVVSVDGVSSAVQQVSLARFAPAIFPGAVLNQDSTVNSAANAAPAGTVVQVFATGLTGALRITARVHDRAAEIPLYAGPAPGLIGVQQVNVLLPADLPAMTTEISICGSDDGDPAQTTCSAPARITLASAPQ